MDMQYSDPWDEIPDREKQRLNDETDALIDAGAYDPDNEILEE